MKGRKRHILVDTLGFPIANRVEPASVSDRRAGAVLRHDEAKTRMPGTGFAERELFHDRWRDAMDDPFYSPMLGCGGETIALADV